MSWAKLETEAPDLARLGRERLEACGLALLATLRRGGWPRISPIEPFFAEGELVFGVMRSGKARDLARDSRCTLQSVVTAPDAGEGELKLYGRAVAAGDDLRASVGGAWWLERPAAEAAVYRFDIEEAVFVEWHLADGRMTLRRWSPGRGTTETSRTYP